MPRGREERFGKMQDEVMRRVIEEERIYSVAAPPAFVKIAADGVRQRKEGMSSKMGPGSVAAGARLEEGLSSQKDVKQNTLTFAQREMMKRRERESLRRKSRRTTSWRSSIRNMPRS